MGYLIIDNTASGGEKHEYDTTQCRHCQKVLDLARCKKEGGYWKCSGCQGPVCWECVGLGQDGNGNVACDPWQAKIDRALKEANQGVFI